MVINKKLIEQILQIVDTTLEGSTYVNNRMIKDAMFSDYAVILMNIREAMDVIQKNLIPIKHEIEYCAAVEIAQNVVYSIERVFNNIDSSDTEKATGIIEYEIIPLLKELKENLYFYALVYPDKDRLTEYYKKEYVIRNSNEFAGEDHYVYEASIIIPAYNKLEYTKRCIESVYEYTSKINYELIVINHGSTDGTREYFQTLTNAKVVDFKHNMGLLTCYNITSRIKTNGKYLVGVSNDIIVTEGWLDNLINCIKSDDKIAWVVPTTNSISNLQSIKVNYKNIAEMHQFAKRYNIPNPNKWEQRARLMPMLLVSNKNYLSKYGIGFPDRFFRLGEFCDDDAALRLRRKGFKMILAKDTYVHHYGSVSLGEGQRKRNTLGISRQLFIDKYGLDPWANGYCYDSLLLEGMDAEKIGSVRVLGIDAGFGDTPLQLKNKYRNAGNYDVTIYNYTTDTRFIDDLKGVSDYVEHGSKVDEILEIYKDEQFDHVLFCESIERYDDFMNLLQKISSILKDNGKIGFTVKNPYHYRMLYNLLDGKLVGAENGGARWYDVQELPTILKNAFSNVKIYGEYNVPDDADREYIQLLSKISAKNNLKEPTDLFAKSRFVYLLTK